MKAVMALVSVEVEEGRACVRRERAKRGEKVVVGSIVESVRSTFGRHH